MESVCNRLIISMNIYAYSITTKLAFMAGSAGLVPGDLIAFTGRVTLPCDMVLLTGSCNVDESTITGVMVPAVKIPYQADLQKFGEKHPVMSDNKLIGGTRVLSAKSTNDLPVCAQVNCAHTGGNIGDCCRNTYRI